MRRVHDVDADLIKRAAEWLLAQQNADGSWDNDRGLVHEEHVAAISQNDRLPVTAYIVWSLIDAGFGNDAAHAKRHRPTCASTRARRRSVRAWRWWPMRWSPPIAPRG